MGMTFRWPSLVFPLPYRDSPGTATSTEKPLKESAMQPNQITPNAKNLVGSPDAGLETVDAHHRGSSSCKDITDHDLENAVKHGRAKWCCPRCGADVSLAYLFYAMAVEREDYREL